MEKTNVDVRDLHLARKKLWDNSIASHAKYIDPTSNLFAAKFTEARSCPTCESSSEAELFHRSGGRYVRCTKCEMVYLNPVFTDDALENYYRNNHAVQAQIVSQDMTFYRDLYVQGLTSFEPLFPVASERSILDIGCSAGAFLNIAKERGWKTYGLEFNRAEIAACRQSGHEAFEVDLREFVATSKLKVDAVSLWDVFEHIKNGAETLRNARKLLKDGGGVFLQSPTPNSLAARILQEKCNMFDGLEHVNLYTYENIVELAKKTGFEVTSYRTVISEAGVLRNYLDYQNPYLGVARDSAVGGKLLSEAYIHENNLGYKYQIFMRKTAN